MSFVRVLVLLASVALTACANPLTKNIAVDSEYDSTVDFSQIKTYTWLASAQIINDPKGQWEPRGFDADEEIRFLINRELRTRGFTQVENNPDVYVAFLAGVNMEALNLDKDPKTKLRVLTKEPEGALAIVLLDATTSEAVWGAVAGDRVDSEMDVESSKKRLDYAVTKMIDRLPRS
ncbi:MAG: DUF4136 domain-containing protein [Gammaproteobacteria bacterium]